MRDPSAAPTRGKRLRLRCNGADTRCGSRERVRIPVRRPQAATTAGSAATTPTHPHRDTPPVLGPRRDTATHPYAEARQRTAAHLQIPHIFSGPAPNMGPHTQCGSRETVRDPVRRPQAEAASGSAAMASTQPRRDMPPVLGPRRNAATQPYAEARHRNAAQPQIPHCFSGHAPNMGPHTQCGSRETVRIPVRRPHAATASGCAETSAPRAFSHPLPTGSATYSATT
ncbi:hypothetical protein DFR70_101485 [Nocardia tenerifensis]|uniref:Uncharacterized protein n=1 Tax=Nocardia tenerifensis TaxID=228006 RepID=A0A318KYY4_9NOCA|nr:hypothetical protein DFR70_101485 [Nocardia tenerifensis]